MINSLGFFYYKFSFYGIINNKETKEWELTKDF
jgi:hypothetical protein